MKKCKLIQVYPGSPKLGTELTPKVDKENSNTNNFYWEGSWFNPKDFSEFWEEVVEKDYEVLIAKIVPYTILSVKRLSDGEVFTVGDRAKVYEYGSIKTIDSMTLVTECSSMKEGIWLNYNSGSSHIIHAIKQVEQPIFLTHDGKDIFAGDKVWYVHKGGRSMSINYLIPSLGTTFRSESYAYFLTKEAAEDYVEKNKVLFTTEDGVGIKVGDTYYFVDTDFSISLSNALPGCGQYSERKYFSTYETAEYYVIVNAKVLSIEEFWEFVSKPASNIVKQKQLKRLVKERLIFKVR